MNKFNSQNPHSINEIKASIPGTVIRIIKKETDFFQPGETLLIIESMKMENEIYSEIKGIIKTILVVEGQKVKKDDVLIIYKQE